MFLVCFLFLCGCKQTTADKLMKLGYSEEDINLIEKLSEENQNLFLEDYKETELSYLYQPDFREENLEEYLNYHGLLDQERVIRLVNEGILNKGSFIKLFELYNHPYFIEKNEEKYLRYLNEYDSLRDMIEIVNTQRDRELFTGIENVDLSKGDLMLVNKYYQLSEDYVPDDLVNVEEGYGRGRLKANAYEAFVQMADDAYKLGYDLRVVSSFRSYSYQEGLYNSYLKYDTLENVDSYSARDGHSEHQTGLAIDVSVPGVSLDDFYKTEAAKWVDENCYKYGFIVRYQDNKKDITGYIDEPWHIRYLNKEIAADVYKRGITYDEYYAVFIE